MEDERYNGVVDEILYYSERTDDGRWVIPIEVDWDYTLTKCSCWEDGTMEINYEAFDIMKRWTKDYNVGWILNSMRHDEILKEPLKILEKEGVKLYSLRKNPRQDKDGNEVMVEGSSVICALGQRSRTDVVNELLDAAPFVRVIGDAAKVSTITNAVYWGYHAALDV
jgi:hypothetical protein